MAWNICRDLYLHCRITCQALTHYVSKQSHLWLPYVSQSSLSKYSLNISVPYLEKHHRYLLVPRFKYFQNWLLSPILYELDNHILLELFLELIHRYKSYVTIHTIMIFFTHLSFAAMTLKQYNVILQVYAWCSVFS